MLARARQILSDVFHAPANRERVATLERQIERVRHDRQWDIAKVTRLNQQLHSRASTSFAFNLHAGQHARVRNIARYLLRNHPVAASIIDYYVAVILGPEGIWPTFNTGDTAFDKRANALFYDWAEAVDPTGEVTWNDLQEMWVREIAATGEAMTETGIDKRSGRFVARAFEPEQLASWAFGGHVTLGKDEQTNDGIVYDSFGRKTKYLVMDATPESYITGTALDYREIPAERVAHIYCKKRPTQYRGESPFDSTGQTLFDQQDIDFGELQLVRAAGYFGIYLKQDASGMTPPNELDGLDEDPDNEQGRKTSGSEDSEIYLEPGSMREGTATPHILAHNHPPADYQTFRRSLIMLASARFNTPYTAASGDTSQANYSSMRGEEMHCRPGRMRDQRRLAYKGAQRVVQNWLMAKLVTGELELPAGAKISDVVRKIKYNFYVVDWVDPQNESKAEAAQLETGVMSWDEAVERHGRDPEQVIEQLKKLKALNDQHNLNLPGPWDRKKESAPAPEQKPEADAADDDSAIDMKKAKGKNGRTVHYMEDNGHAH